MYMVIAISKIDEKIVDSILEDKPQIFITIDKLFENNDQLKNQYSSANERCRH